mmetsp:Transcript_76134/g.134723  ORF Transcript_76134/g.134723 Transcript_76134/m.134723 type:complete len:86 (+) Transcript_76134:1645-1902(+)
MSAAAVSGTSRFASGGEEASTAAEAAMESPTGLLADCTSPPGPVAAVNRHAWRIGGGGEPPLPVSPPGTAPASPPETPPGGAWYE